MTDVVELYPVAGEGDKLHEHRVLMKFTSRWEDEAGAIEAFIETLFAGVRAEGKSPCRALEFFSLVDRPPDEKTPSA